MTKQIRTLSGAPRRLAGLYVISFFVLLGAVSSVKAAEWSFAPVLRVAGDFDDNPYLSHRTDNAESVNGYILEGSAEVAYRSEKSNFDFTPTLRRRDYGSDSDLNSDDQFLTTSFSHNTIATNFRIRANFDRQSVRTAERADVDLEAEDPDDILDDDTGRVGVRGRRERVRVSPSFLYRASEASSIIMQVNYTDVVFDDDVGLFLTDYTDWRANVFYRRKWSERFTAVFAATYRSYDTEFSLSEVTGAGASFGIDREMSETSRLRLSIGFENTDSGGGSAVTEPVAALSYVRRQKTTTLLASYRRSVTASGAGALGIRDSFTLNFTRRLNDRMSAGIGARAYSTDAIDETSGPLDERVFLQLKASLTWHISQTVSLQTDYHYTFLDREVLGESSNSNQITVWLNWIPTPMVRSR